MPTFDFLQGWQQGRGGQRDSDSACPGRTKPGRNSLAPAPGSLQLLARAELHLPLPGDPRGGISRHCHLSARRDPCINPPFCSVEVWLLPPDIVQLPQSVPVTRPTQKNIFFSSFFQKWEDLNAFFFFFYCFVLCFSFLLGLLLTDWDFSWLYQGAGHSPLFRKHWVMDHILIGVEVSRKREHHRKLLE